MGLGLPKRASSHRELILLIACSVWTLLWQMILICILFMLGQWFYISRVIYRGCDVHYFYCLTLVNNPAQHNFVIYAAHTSSNSAASCWILRLKAISSCRLTSLNPWKVVKVLCDGYERYIMGWRYIPEIWSCVFGDGRCYVPGKIYPISLIFDLVRPFFRVWLARS